jgi:hypothetical protein
MSFTISINDQAAFEVQFAGPAGPTGPQGPQGIQGEKGDKGDTGAQGPQGIQGIQGIQGVKGDKGDQGDVGPVGPQGQQGIQGEKGDKGDQGIQGIQGIQGVKGDQGDQGPQGIQGDQGPKGDKGDQGDQGPQGDKGDKGDQGDPGPPGVVFANAPLSYDAQTQTVSIDLAGYATESWVQSQGYVTSVNLSDYAALAGADFHGRVTFQNQNPSIAPLGISPYAQDPSSFENGDVWFNHQQGRMSYYYAQQSGSGVRYVATTNDLAGYYLNSNPAGFITSAALAPYRPLTNTTFGNVFISASNVGYIYVNPNPAQGETLQSVIQTKGLLIRDAQTIVPVARFEADIVQIPPAGITFSDFTVQTSAGVTMSVLADYAQLAGATFTGKVNCTSVNGNAGLNVGIGGTSTDATSPGDLWISTNGTNLNFRDGQGAWRILVNTSNTNTFSAPQIIDTTATTPALRVTQKGTGNSLIVEDSTTPDTSALVVDQNGNVGIGVATGYTSTAKLEVVGNVKGTTLSTGSGPVFSVNSTAAHSGGSDTLDLIVTIGGVNYRIGLRPA